MKKIPFWKAPLSTVKKIPFLVKKIPFWMAPQKRIKLRARVFFRRFFKVVSFETMTPDDDSLLRVSRIGAWSLLIA